MPQEDGVLVIHCSDPRYQIAFQDFLRNKLGLDHYALIAVPGLPADTGRLTPEQRIELIRGLSAEYATAKIQLPRSKKTLNYETTGKFDKKTWDDAFREFGPAARTGDLVQISKIGIEDDKILLEINGGFKGGRKWYERIQVGTGRGTVPIAQGQSNAPGGTSIALLFHKPLPALTSDEVKKILKPILDFEKRSAAESYVESLPAPIQQAVKEKRAIEGMDRDQVVLALGRPVRKIRETTDGSETEDWVYGTPPGKIVFVTFSGSKVIKVKETYAGLGTEAPTLPPPR